ncbi:Pkinase-domain-containing protein [Panus rudis PR-1116 ss-1]|nr:Pkinase-domain-containing protein [Panus rudis PR-1116 ss-1]
MPGTPPKPPAVPDKPRGQSSPPLPRQKAKAPPPTPPKVIADKSRTLEFVRVGMLGEGGFARVYEVRDRTGARSACKVVTKDSLSSKKAKTKLYAEIKIHRSLNHPNIVRFQDCFEDDMNVYMTLELCHNGSLMDMLRRRRRFTEPESRFFMVQLIGACEYMHTHQVIHRDLKLGNIFLDQNMNVKVGDFGLAALIENPGERKKTICGTPNYIAPEVLFDTANGHSFEVDTWSIGVILYTLVIGRPPFQTKDVKNIYKRIRDNVYEFPTDRIVSLEVQDLVQQILTPNPQERPTLHEIVDHVFFTNGIVPSYIPPTAHDSVPDFRGITRQQSQMNLARLRKEALLDEEMGDGNGVTTAASSAAAAATVATSTATNRTETAKIKGVSSSLAQQEKEFQKAVQPGSPISALLSSARQPLLVAPLAVSGVTALGRADQPLIRKLQAARDRDGKGKSPGRPGVGGREARLQNIVEEEEDRYAENRRKELEAQKARIVAQMVPNGNGEGKNRHQDPYQDQEQEEDGEEEEQENVPPFGSGVEEIRRKRYDEPHLQPLRKEKERERVREGHEHPRPRHRIPTSSSTSSSTPSVPPNPPTTTNPGVPSTTIAPSVPPSTSGIPPLKPNGFDLAAQTLTAAFDAKSKGKLFRDPRGDVSLPDPKVFIVSWVDYCNKYGMGYALTDGSVGVHFNDSTSLVLGADKHHFDYITLRRQGTVYVRKNHTVTDYPSDLKSKVYLLKHFERYIMDRLYGEHEYTYEDLERTKGMDFVQKYLRMKHVIVFKMSHDVLQFNFYDHSKLILSSNGLVVTHIDKSYQLTRYTLSEIMAYSLNISPTTLKPLPHSSSAVNGGSHGGHGVNGNDPEQTKTMQRLVDKLKYCKEVLVSIRNVSSASAVGDGKGGGGSEDGLDAGERVNGGERERVNVNAKASKASLR